MDRVRRERLSKLMSGILRHFPEQIGLHLDDEGFVGLDELVEAIKYRWKGADYSWVTVDSIREIIESDPRGRFEIVDGRIRAVYGHSVRVRIRYPLAKRYPRFLYHGTSRDRLNSILKRGILPMRRLYVHLTDDRGVALNIGRRHGEPIVLVIDTSILVKTSIKIFRGGRMYLVKWVPPEAIREVLD